MYLEQMKLYFGLYGRCKVTTVEFLSETQREFDIPDESTYWYIYYVDESDASRVLQDNVHVIDGVMCAVEAAESWLQYKRPDPEARIRTLKLQAYQTDIENDGHSYNRNMNADCWEDVCKYLDLEDLCAVADTCLAANEGATRIAKKKVKNLELNFTMNESTRLQTRTMAVFGAAVNKVNVRCFGTHAGKEFRMKSEYFHNLIDCYGLNVQSLRWPYGETNICVQFENLKSLLQMNIDNDYRVWDGATNMKCLSWTIKLILNQVTFSDVVWSTLKYRMPRLCALAVTDSIGFDVAKLRGIRSLRKMWLLDWNRGALVNYLVANSKLKEIHLSDSGGLFSEVEYMQMVAAYRQSGRHLVIRSAMCRGDPTIAASVLEANKEFVELTCCQCNRTAERQK